MSEQVSVALKQRFSTKTDLGKVFYWLRYSSLVSFEEAISHALRIVYLPSALCEDPGHWYRVHPVRQELSQSFEEWMSLTTTNAPTKKIPAQVYVNVSLRSPQGSDNGKSWSWMLQQFGKETANEIIKAVALVFLPVALRTFPEDKERADLMVFRAKMAFANIRANDVLPPAGQVFSPIVSNGLSQQGDIVLELPKVEAIQEPETIDKTEPFIHEGSPKVEEYRGGAFMEMDLDAIYDDETNGEIL
jgi:hypothetical protein